MAAITLQEIWHQLISRDNTPFVQFLKYVLVGGMSTGVHILSFFLFGWKLFPCVDENDIVVRILHLKAPVLDEKVRARNAVYANIIAFILSNLFCFILNRLFVFKPGRHGLALEAFLFFAVSAVAIALGTLLMRWLIRHFRMQTTFAFGANLVTSLMFNFVLRKYVIFQG